jgi:NADH-quinone oxidoreductase subunit I
MPNIFNKLGWDILKSLLVTISYFFRKKVTLLYPEQQRAKPSRFRGLPGLLRDAEGKEKCIACKLCVTACPSRAITVIGTNQAEIYELNVGKCLVCGLCEQICPVKAIKMTDKLFYHITKRSELVFSKERLLNMDAACRIYNQA